MDAKPPLGNGVVIAHDVGAVNQIREFANHWCQTVQWVMRDDSARMSDETAESRQLLEALRHADVLITGTSWSTSIEARARRLAREMKLASWTYVDHWTEIELRFNRWSGDVLPDGLVVADARVLTRAVEQYPELNVLVVPNYYLNLEVSAARSLRAHSELTYALFMGEPQRRHGITPKLDEVLMIDAIERAVERKVVPEDLEVLVRPHPSQRQLDWTLPDQVKGRNIRVASENSLAQDLSGAAVVLGFETFALEIAAAAGIPTFTCLLPGMLPLLDLHPSIGVL